MMPDIINLTDYAPGADGMVHRVYRHDSPEVRRLLNLFAYRESVHDGDDSWYIVCPNGRFFYALTPATLDRWYQHIRCCLDESRRLP